MSQYYILYNPKAGNNKGKIATEKLNEYLPAESLEFIDITTLEDYTSLFDKLMPEDVLVVCGGDGTLNRFVNDIDGILPENDILYYATGSGNDFLHDLGKGPGAAPISIKEYITHLPTVTVNGKDYKFINGIGYGIDGYCCEVGDKLRETTDKPINYASIAIKGLLFHYKRTNAVITVDGQKKQYKKVWLAPTMNGRFYGGGMMPTPVQDRLHNETVSTLVMYGSGKLKTLMVFPSIFKGEHVKHTEMVEVLTGKSITVEFDRPTAIQIDGETILGVTKYSVAAAANAAAKSYAETESVQDVG